MLGSIRTSGFHRYLRCLVAAMPGRVIAALVLTVSLGLTEGIGVLLLVPLLDAVGVPLGQGSAASLRAYVAAAFARVGLEPTLAVALGIYIAVVTAQALLTRLQVHAVLTLEHRFAALLRKRLYAAITRANWLYLSSVHAPELAHALIHHVDRVGTVTYQALALCSNTLIALVYLALAFRLSPAMTGLVLACGAVLLAALRPKVVHARVQGEEVSEAVGRLYTAAVEHVAGLRAAKSYDAEQRHIDSLARVADAVADAQLDAVRIHAASRSWFDIGGVIALAFLLFTGLRVFAMSPASVLLLLYVFARTMPRLSAAQQAAQQVSHFLPSFTAVADLQAQAARHAEPVPASSVPVAFSRSIAFDHVSFAHGQDTPGAVQDLSLRIDRGTTTAIVGPSGAGKSTVADLLAGLQRPQEGHILIDGIALDDERLGAWRAGIGYVHQDTFLFNDTVRANLAWASPGASEDDVRQALVLAAAEFVFELPLGLDTKLGERGLRLSGGERQRLALARALLRKPRLLLLDEATSALDSVNETRILDAIDRLHGSLTIVIITHRLAAVRRCEMIHVLEEGRLVESGDWGTLSGRASGRFRAFCDAQAAAQPDVAPIPF